MADAGKTAYDDNNVFAHILRGEIPCRKLFENEYALAFHDINPQSPTHVLVIPKKPYVSFADFSAQASEEEITGFIRAIGQVTRMLNLEENGYRLLSNMGRDSHQEVPHFHVHIFAGRPLGSMLSRPG